MKRLSSLFISTAMFSIVIPVIHLILTFVLPSLASAHPFRFGPIILVAVIGLLPPIFGGCYFMAYAIGQNPNSGKWIRQFTKVFLLSSYFVGIFFILETSFLLLFPEGYFEIQLYLYAVAIFIVAFTPRLLVFVKRKLRKEPKSVTLNEEY